MFKQHITEVKRLSRSRPHISTIMIDRVEMISDASQPHDDWTRVTDPVERRRIQNRIAQRTFRQNSKKRKLQLQAGGGQDIDLPEDTSANNTQLDNAMDPPHSQLSPRTSVSCNRTDFPDATIGWQHGPFTELDWSTSLSTEALNHTISATIYSETVGIDGGEDPTEALSFNGFQSHSRSLTTQEWATLALHTAAERGNEEVVRLLLNKGVDASAEDSNGLTALHISAREGHNLIVRLLLERGASVESVDRWQRTPLSLARERHNNQTILLLLGSSEACTDQLWQSAEGLDTLVLPQ